ncbi:radical SAM protein [bacterium]|nr:radical SAM protein [bacterium]
MNLKSKILALEDDIIVTVKEAAYRNCKPQIELSLDNDGLIYAQGKGLIGSRIQGIIDHNTDKQKEMKIIAHRNGGNVYSLYYPPLPSKPGMRAIDYHIRGHIFHLRTPSTNTMAVTYKCNCSCEHCSAEVKIDPRREELTTEEWKKVIDDGCKLGVYNHVFTGGEPCVRKDLPELIAHVTSEKGTTLMFTNGTLLKKRAKELADAGLYAVNVSIDNIDPKVHNKLRGMKNCYEKALEGAAAVRELGVLTGLSTYATKETIHNGSVEKLIQLADEEGFIEVTIFDPMPSGRWMHDTSFVLDEDDRAYLRKLTLDSRLASNTGPAVIAQSYINSPYGLGCFGAYDQFYTTAYGDINPCDFNPVTFGNTRKEGVIKSWHRMIHHEEFRHKRKNCRMQNPEYRKKFIDTVPAGLQWPIPIEFYESNGKFKPVKAYDASVENHKMHETKRETRETVFHGMNG